MTLKNFVVKTEVIVVAESEKQACETVEDWLCEAMDYQFISVESAGESYDGCSRRS